MRPQQPIKSCYENEIRTALKLSPRNSTLLLRGTISGCVHSTSCYSKFKRPMTNRAERLGRPEASVFLLPWWDNGLIHSRVESE
jgi:hypothetical protein